MKDAEAPLAIHDEIVEKFFRVPQNSSDALKGLIAEIKRQDDKSHFAATIANVLHVILGQLHIQKLRIIL